jgi:hypothetical protein
MLRYEGTEELDFYLLQSDPLFLRTSYYKGSELSQYLFTYSPASCILVYSLTLRYPFSDCEIMLPRMHQALPSRISSFRPDIPAL